MKKNVIHINTAAIQSNGHTGISSILTGLAVSIVAIVILFSIYENVIYPIKQFFKKRNSSGYILVGNEFEHRILAEKWMGRNLRPEEEVHHINGKKWDNRKRNLAVVTKRNHQRWHQRLDWMFSQKMFPSIAWQRKKLISEFQAKLF